MMDYGPYWVWYKLRKRMGQLDWLIASMGYVLSWIKNVGNTGGSGSIIIRDAPTDPEPNPPNVEIVTLLHFRDLSPSKTWDPDAEPPAWI